MQRVLALALALWAAFGPTAAVLHLATAPHAICPEHGELIELGAPSPGAASAAAHQGWSSAAPANEEATDLDAHGHCTASIPLRSPALSAPRATLAVEVTGHTGRMNELAARVPLAAPCVLTCAPKQSPPPAA